MAIDLDSLKVIQDYLVVFFISAYQLYVNGPHAEYYSNNRPIFVPFDVETLRSIPPASTELNICLNSLKFAQSDCSVADYDHDLGLAVKIKGWAFRLPFSKALRAYCSYKTTFSG